VALALLGALGCKRQEVSLGDDTPLLGGVDAATIAEPDAAPPVAPAEDAGDFWGEHHPPMTPQDAGGFRDDDDFECDFCSPGELCTRPDDPSCAARLAPARCQSIEEVCSSRPEPVCGCDGQSYASRCEAIALGVSVRAEGSCGPVGSTVQCASFAGAGCGPDAYCRFALGAYCGASGVLGTCEPKPFSCGDSGRTVCGCDGRSYESGCEASMAGVSVAYLGPCDQGGQPGSR
jgi:hypothetical protein